MHTGLFGKLIEETITEANSGDTEAAKQLMKWYCGAIKQNTDKDGNPHRKPSGIGTQIDERILRYFAECFGLILNGVEVKRALSLENPKNRPTDTKLKERNIDLAIELEQHIKDYPKKSMTDIYAEVGGTDKNINGDFERGKSQSKLKEVRKEDGELAKLVLEMGPLLTAALAELRDEYKKG